MRISDVLRVKGAQVVTVTPDTTVRGLLAVLAEHGIGAVVVSRDGTSVDGIVSERDIVRALALRGAAVMSEQVTAIYTADVHTVTPETGLEEVARMMTEHRIRHAPVTVDGRLRGIVSIGDVVKSRIRRSAALYFFGVERAETPAVIVRKRARMVKRRGMQPDAVHRGSQRPGLLNAKSQGEPAQALADELRH
jgi:CBS domain-containing protein